MKAAIPLYALWLSLFVAPISHANPSPDFGPVCGGVTPASATFVVGLQEYGDEVCIILKKGRFFSKKIRSGMFMASEGNAAIAKISVGGLEPDTRYYYNVEINGRQALDEAHSFRTFPEGRASFKFTFGNSLRVHRPNQNGMLASIQEEPLFFLNTGDLHYADLGVDYVERYREAVAVAYNSIVHRESMRDTPLVYIYDDHDFGPNNSDKTHPGRNASVLSYRQMVPHYPLVDPASTGSVHQAFSVGRTRFILTDLRSERSPDSDPDTPEKTMMGFKQREWFLNELKESAQTHALVFWVSSVPWSQDKKEGSDQWGGFTHERRLIADFIAEEQIDNLIIIAGDAHSMSADDGTHGDYSTNNNMPRVPEIISAPLDNDHTSIKGGPFSHGVYRAEKGENVYGLVEVEDRGHEIVMKFTGKTHRHDPVVEMTHAVNVELP